MKKIAIIIILLLSTIGQAQEQSHIKTIIYKTETATSVADPSVSQAIQNFSYFDKLGRPIQHRAYMQSNTGKDIVTHIEYDASGRQSKGFLPYVSTSATKQYDANAATKAFPFMLRQQWQELEILILKLQETHILKSNLRPPLLEE
ncbi:hypothetical protein H9W95_01135 [Flavobacterium lindanitolerans]|nr:hypothetical protein [Flavobacterium lindanitolerans]